MVKGYTDIIYIGDEFHHFALAENPFGDMEDNQRSHRKNSGFLNTAGVAQGQIMGIELKRVLKEWKVGLPGG